MSARYHINKKGEAKLCKASKRACRYESAGHFTSEEEALKALYQPTVSLSRRKALIIDDAISCEALIEKIKVDNQLPNWHERLTFTKTALRDKKLYGDSAKIFVRFDGEGRVLGAASLLYREAEEGAEEWESVPELEVINYLGATQAGGGKELAKDLQAYCKERKIPLMLEPTDQSRRFWRETMQAEEDPLEIGTIFLGWDYR